MEKRDRASFSLLSPLRTCTSRSYPLILWITISAFLSEPVTPAAAERQERSDRVSEEASFHLSVHRSAYVLHLHFSPAI